MNVLSGYLKDTVRKVTRAASGTTKIRKEKGKIQHDLLPEA